jgi:hypothetical protein
MEKEAKAARDQLIDSVQTAAKRFNAEAKVRSTKVSTNVQTIV